MISKETVIEALDIPAFFAAELPSLKGQGEERMALCPFHEDSTPSFSVNVKTGRWMCHGCSKKGDTFSFVEEKRGVTFSEALTELAQIAHVPIPQSGGGMISDKQIVAWQEALANNPQAMKYLRGRGYTAATIKEYRLGWNGQRVTMPVYDHGKLYAVKCWLIQHHPTYARCVWMPKGKHAGIYPRPPVEQEVWLCEGEWDCILARQHGLAAYTGMAGAGTFQPHWVDAFAGKTVNIVYDCDKAGREGAEMAAKHLGEVAKVRIVALPEPDVPVPGFDMTNYLRDHQGTAATLRELTTATPLLDFQPVESATKGLDIEPLIPPRSWLRSYMDWATAMTDAPPIFHLASAMTTLATAAGDKVWTEAWGMRVYPNLWSVLVAPTGFYRKSTCMGFGLDLIRQVDLKWIYPNKFTEEKFLKILSERASGVISIDEFGSFLNSLGRDYLSGLKELLTELYGNKPYLRETMKDTSRIESHSISILAGSTIEWLRGRAAAGDLEAGFLPRFLFWRGDTKLPRKGWTWRRHDPVEEYLAQHLRWISELPPRPALPSDEVRTRFDEWNEKHEAEVNSQQLPSSLRGFYTRLATYTLKFALLYQLVLTVDGFSWVITLPALEYAIKLVEYLKRSLIETVEEYLVQGRDAQDIDKVAQALKDLGGEASRSALLRRSRMLVQHFDKVMATLIQSGEVGQVAGQSTGGRAPMLYVSKNGKWKDE